MPFEGGDRVSSSASNSLAHSDPMERTETSQVDSHGHPIDLVPMPIPRPMHVPKVRYVLSPSPSFDPVFDDLLEGGTGSGMSSGPEQLSTKSENSAVEESSRNKIEYLNELLRDEKRLSQVPGFRHLHKLLKQEIERVRDELRLHDTPVGRMDGSTFAERQASIIHKGRFNLDPFNEMPPPEGPIATVVDKVYPPVDQYPGYNFIGRLVGPRGRTVKQIENESGCMITIRGKGSEKDGNHMRKRGQLAYEHETEPLHVRIAATDHKERAQFKVRRAKYLIQRLLVPVGNDELKELQLRELAMIRSNQEPKDGGAVECPVPAACTPTQMQQPPFPFVPSMVDPCGNLVYIAPETNGFVPMVWPRAN